MNLHLFLLKAFGLGRHDHRNIQVKLGKNIFLVQQVSVDGVRLSRVSKTKSQSISETVLDKWTRFHVMDVVLSRSLLRQGTLVLTRHPHDDPPPRRGLP